MSPVVLIMIDGLRPDAIDATTCPNLRALRARSAWTMQARSVMPSITLPCHTSIFHSVPPSRHGITTNTFVPFARPIPGLLEQAKANNLRSGMFYNWEELRDVGRPGSLAVSLFRETAYVEDGDAWLAEAAAEVLESGQLDFAFVYFGTVDSAGHAFGWMSEGYLAQVTRIDSYLGGLLERLPEESQIILHSDHGGHERTHGTDSPEDMTIPWLAAGPGIRQGEIQAPVSLLDTAPTIAHLLGIPAYRDWEGRVVEEILA